MSLFEQFFSDVNKKFMFDMIGNIFQKDYTIDIKQDQNNYKLMDEKMKSIFEDNNFEDISDINEALLKTVLNELKSKYIDTPVEKGEDFDKSLEKLMKDRNNITQPSIPKKDTEIKSTPVQQLLINNENRLEKIPENDNKDEEIYHHPIVKLNSNKRINIQSSRYNYIFDLKKEGIVSQDLVEISKLIIPIESNYLFNIPLLMLTIKELDVSVYLQQEELITNKNNTIGIYKPIEKCLIEPKTIDRITIDIRDMTGEKYKHNDILKINIIEVKDNVIIFTCSNVTKNNYKINDMIKVLNVNTFEMELLEIISYPLKVSAIKNNMIFCSFEGDKKNKIYNNIDMKIINMSNQNLLIFNQSS